MKNPKNFKFFITTLILLVFTTLFATDGEHCGEPIIKARFTFNKASLNNENLTEKELYENLTLISRENLSRLKKSILPLSDEEKKLFDKFLNTPFYISHRLPIKRLRSVLKSQALLAPKTAKDLGLILDAPYTPSLEDKLFGAYDCVFSAIGPKYGRDYGNVILRISNKSQIYAWASLSSGYHFIKSINPSIVSINLEPSVYETLAFSTTIVVQKDWRKYFAYMTLSLLRKNMADKRRYLTRKLLEENNREAFWQIIDDNRLGYLEAKYSRLISISEIESIEALDEESRKAICEMPEAIPFLNKITHSCQNELL